MIYSGGTARYEDQNQTHNSCSTLQSVSDQSSVWTSLKSPVPQLGTTKQHRFFLRETNFTAAAATDGGRPGTGEAPGAASPWLRGGLAADAAPLSVLPVRRSLVTREAVK